MAIPDLKIEKIEFLSQTEEKLTWQRTFSGTHKVELQGIPASMRKVKWNEIVVTRFEGEKIAKIGWYQIWHKCIDYLIEKLVGFVPFFI